MSEIVELLKERESEKVEFKESVSQMDKIVESISAFSNTNEGTVVIGVRDKGGVLGVDIGKRTIENLANRIKQNTDPMVYPSIHVEKPFFQKESFTKEKSYFIYNEKIDDKHVVVIEVEDI